MLAVLLKRAEFLSWLALFLIVHAIELLASVLSIPTALLRRLNKPVSRALDHLSN